MNAELERRLTRELRDFIKEEKIRERMAAATAGAGAALRGSEQVEAFRALAKKNEWPLSKAMEKRMVAYARKHPRSPRKPFRTKEEGVKYLVSLYRAVRKS